MVLAKLWKNLLELIKTEKLTVEFETKAKKQVKQKKNVRRRQSTNWRK